MYMYYVPDSGTLEIKNLGNAFAANSYNGILLLYYIIIIININI